LKKLFLIVFFIFLQGCAKQNQNKETEEFKKFQIVMSWYCDNISTHLETEKVVALKKCSHENIYCKSILGNIYYRMKQYDKAYDLLIESQGDLKGYGGATWAPSEMALGEMYAYGRGVNEDKGEAKEHFTKCALTGNKACISWMISYAKADLADILKDAQQQATYYHNSGLENGVHNRIDYAARELLYWYTIGSWDVIGGGGGHDYGDEINELKKIIINKKVAEEWETNAIKTRESFIMTLSGLHYTYPYCDRRLSSV
jgi:hypothetical protein